MTESQYLVGNCLAGQQASTQALHHAEVQTDLLAMQSGQRALVETYLEAAVAWAEHTPVFPETLSWRAFATFLYARTWYE